MSQAIELLRRILAGCDTREDDNGEVIGFLLRHDAGEEIGAALIAAHALLRMGAPPENGAHSIAALPAQWRKEVAGLPGECADAAERAEDCADELEAALDRALTSEQVATHDYHERGHVIDRLRAVVRAARHHDCSGNDALSQALDALKEGDI